MIEKSFGLLGVCYEGGCLRFIGTEGDNFVFHASPQKIMWVLMAGDNEYTRIVVAGEVKENGVINENAEVRILGPKNELCQLLRGLRYSTVV